MTNLIVYSAEEARKQSLANLESQVDAIKLNEAMNRIADIITDSINEGNFSCMITNDVLEDLFSTEEEAFDDTLIQLIVNKLKSAGFTVKYDELLYSDISNIIEISW